MFEIEPDINQIRFNHDKNVSYPAEPLFFNRTRVIYLKQNNGKLILGVNLHKDDKDREKDLFESLVLSDVEFKLIDSEFKYNEFSWPYEKDLNIRFHERVEFKVVIL